MLGPCEVMAASMLPVSPRLTPGQPFPLPTITLSAPHARSRSPAFSLIKPWPPGTSSVTSSCLREGSHSCQDFSSSFWDVATCSCLDFRFALFGAGSCCTIVARFTVVVVCIAVLVGLKCCWVEMV